MKLKVVFPDKTLSGIAFEVSLQLFVNSTVAATFGPFAVGWGDYLQECQRVYHDDDHAADAASKMNDYLGFTIRLEQLSSSRMC